MKPITIIGGTFLLWIAARGRFPKYSALVNKNSDTGTPAGGAVAPASNATPSALDAGATLIHDVTTYVWNAFKNT